MAHDFERYPELTNSQMDFYYWESPHKQILEDFDAMVTDVHDGDTIKVKWQERNFEFPIRLSNIAAPELNESGGKESQAWLKSRLEGKNVRVRVDSTNRVEKWGRLLGTIEHSGMDVGEESIFNGHATTWEERNSGKIISPIKDFKI